MGRIKSALEIALEKTESVKSDKESISHFQAKQTGKKLANSFLESGEVSLEAEIKKASKTEQAHLKQGMFDVLVSQINLPAAKEDEKRIAQIGKGLSALINKNQFNQLYGQFMQLVTRYLDEYEQLEKAIIQQYTPKLRQKEEEIFQRLGQRVKLEFSQDPEFVTFYNQNINMLKEKYQAVIEDVREQVNMFFTSQ